MAERLKVTLVRSGINRKHNQKTILKALGLRKLRAQSVLKDSDPVRGMLRKVSHLVHIEVVE